MTIFQRVAFAVVLLLPALISAKPDVGDPPPKAPGKFNCTWRGVFHYPADGNQDPVKFELVMIQHGKDVVGFIKEPNTFGKRKEPWLHAVIKGTVDEKTGELKFTKTYDGTGGEEHDVKYEGKIAQTGTKVEGSWAIGDFGGRFVLDRVANTKPGPFAGVWDGNYKYPAGTNKDDVKFKMLLVHDGNNLVGVIKEVNTFGKRKEPWLQAGVKGYFDEKTGKLHLTKTYDGTGGEDHQVTYVADVSRTKDSASGTWTINDDFSGQFTLQRARLDAKTIENLK